MFDRILNKLSVPQIIVAFFALTILIAGILLSLPLASKSGTATNFIDAIFTATSALCVTGQTTLNTASHWSVFGQLVILSLIELGGLGFMAIVSIVFYLSRTNLLIKHHKIIQESYNINSLSDTRPILIYILSFSITVQVLGAALLSLVFVPQYGWLKGIYFSVFHAISAFCNAGFDLFGDSLIGYQENSFVLLVIAALIFTGGLGFLVWRDLIDYREHKQLLIHSKIVLISTGILLIMSTILFAVFENNNDIFSYLNPFDRLSNILFLAVTPRTAGFANVDYRTLSLASIFLTFLLMFIGGVSGSTAGGIKVNTFAILVIHLLRIFQGRKDVIFKRTIPEAIVRKCVFILSAGIALLAVSSLILLSTETIPEGYGMEYVLMEVFSCFATVGLTMGLTADLTSVGKFVLILLMFMGRVGLITFFWAIGDHTKVQKLNYPPGSFIVG